MKTSLFLSSIIALLLTQLSLYANSAPNIIANNITDYSRVWTDQYGSYGKDYARSMTIDSSGNLYITGNTQGYLDGNDNNGSSDDIFLTKYGRDGVRLWTKQYGSNTTDYGDSVITDSSGNIYITGSTWGDLDGNTNSGFTDLFLTKFSSDGTKLWTKQYGTGTYDAGSSMTIDSNDNIYITGETYGDLDGNSNSGGADIFLAKYGSDGSKLWIEQYGSDANETGRSVTTDNSGNLYITGYTKGGLDGNSNIGLSDIFLTKYGSDGTKEWTKQYGGSSGDTGNSVTIDSSGNIYITGNTGGGLDGNTNSGSSDIFLTKFGSDGDRLWTKQYGSSSREFGNSVTTDSSGNLYITGFTEGGLDGNSNSGLSDIFLTKFNSGGTKLWTKQYGSYNKDSGNSVIADSSGNIYIAGATAGYIDWNYNSGDDDIFLSKFTRTIELDHTEGTEQVIDIYATDTDGDTLIYSISGGVDSNEFTIESASGVVSFAAPPSVYYPTDDNADNIYEVAITVSDGNGGSDTVTLFITVNISNGSSTSPEYTRSWTDQYGSSTQEEGHSIATDSSGYIYITGYTYSAIDGNPSSSDRDAFLSKYSSDGTRLWTKQDGGAHYMIGNSVTTDSNDNIYVTGESWGDIFLSKYNSNGTKLWTIEDGEDWTQDYGKSVTTDSSGNVYITGKSENYIVLGKVSSSGSLLWYRQYRSSSEDCGESVTTDKSGNIYITGTAYGDLDGNTYSGEGDIFLTKFSSAGTKLWTKQYGSSSEDYGESVITDSSGNIYITGKTLGDLDGNTNSGSYDIFLTKFSSSGTKLWTKQYGSRSSDYGESVTIDSGDNLYITGKTSGSLDGNTNSGYSDVFLTKFSSDGTKVWTEQYGSRGHDWGESVSIDSRGNIYIGGSTLGDLDGNTHIGSIDIFLTKFSRTTTLNNTDFTTNGHNDLLWHQESAGAIKIMQMNGMTPEEDISVVSSSNLNLLPKGIGDFTGDGKPDILFHNQNSGNLRIWEMDGTAKGENIQVLGSSNTNLQIAGVGDFDGDGDTDIATFNTNSGALRMWVMEGTTRVDNVLVLTGANTNLVPRGAGDMDGDGIPDIVLRNNNSGAVRVWTMNSNFTRKGNEYVTGSSNTNLELRGVMDIDGDGNNDILNYNTNTGKLRAWLMDGNLKITENAEIVQNLDLDWSVRN